MIEATAHHSPDSDSTMHLLVVAVSFPYKGNPYPSSFIGQQVQLLAERVERITVLSPVPRVPPLVTRLKRFRAKSSLPPLYDDMAAGRCRVLFPRYLKAPGNVLLTWTTAQWCRMMNQAIAQFATHCPVSIVHAHTGDVSSWAAVQVARRHKIPSVVTYHGSEVHTRLLHRQKGWELCRDSFKMADLNLPVSHPLETILRNCVHPTGRCETLLLGVDQRRFYPAAKLSLDPRVLFVGRIERAKGVYDLLEAWVKVLDHCPNAQLTIIGEDRTSGLFSQQARSLGISDSIALKGSLPSSQVADMMRASSIFCLPSHNEGTPVVIMEALSCGLPVVATKVGGIPDIVESDRTGILVQRGDIPGLARSLVSLLHGAGCRTRMGQAAHEFARSYLNAEKTADHLVELYRELITASRGVAETQAGLE